ncbi:type II secretion system protein GspD [Desulfosarcina alkanivorans]|uniref:Type II secretion system protein GspD n=1 Tax=Desulfosarcina alkanivorans TaxID=571177 RepID=A0A5K7YHA8_9BACT|nr:type II secretion system secretin GspD [Desulfosarcina alkanivorans]BBO67450.1 type II secretion system protein GspD [Desulfosarcina alkanivorans]
MKNMAIEHTTNVNGKRTACTLFLVLALLCLPFGAPAQDQPAGAAAGSNGSQRFVSIDFNNVDISVFIKFISELTGKNFVIDQRVKGKVTIISPSKISVEEAYKVFESVLDVHGFATVETGRLIKIIPSPDARTKNIETRTRAKGDPQNDQVVTQLMPLRFADPDEVKRLFTPMVSKSSVILSYAPTNTLIITDNYSNIARLMKILKTIDIPGVGREITVFPIHNADASKLVSLLETVFKTTGRSAPTKKGVAAPDRGAAFVADERTNSIIMVASEDYTNRIRSLIDTLDQETPKGKEKIHVYYLEYAAAEEIVAVLKDLPKEEKTKAAGAKEAPVVSDKVTITADKATNSLIITADRDDYATLVEIIRQIDIPRSMVYIEALIMEVNADKSFDLGTEWVVGDDVSLNQDRRGIVGGGFTTEDSNLQFGSDGSLIPALASGFSLGLFGEAVKIGDISFPSIAAIVQAYKKDRDVNILSTPQLLTTDNQEASITVGKNIPFQTTTSTTNNDTYNSFEYRDVGKTLKITPQINKDRMVRLNLSLEVSALESTTEFRPTTLKRTVETTVMVKDSSTVVIGGLIDDNFSQTEYKVPCLGDIPGLGWLFKTRSKGNEKSNLFIFITPKVIQNPAEASTILESKKTKMDQMREMQIKLYQGGEDPAVVPPVESGPAADPASNAPTGETEPGGTGSGDGVTQIPPAAIESAGSRTDGAYLVQVQSFADERSAIRSVTRLKQMGHQAHIAETDVDGKIWYRVQIGHYPDRATAQTARDTLSGQGMTDTLIIKNGQ